MNILTLNAGSSSIKYKAYELHKGQLIPLLSGLIEGIGEQEGAWHQLKDSKTSLSHYYKTHKQAFNALAENLKQSLQDHPIHGVGHRVVHGGDLYFQPTIISPKVLDEIKCLSQLAPLHNPINALGIEFALHHFPKALQVALFDTGFHHSMPAYIRQYALNSEIAARYQIKRYGFHGINHEYVAQQAAIFLNKPLSDCHLITLHLGNGASACLIKGGKSFDTSMGMTPLAGLIMGTRCGDIDPAIALYLQEQGMSLAEVARLFNQQSGLKGIAKENDMRKLIASANQGEEAAQLAIEMYVYAIQKMIGAYRSQLPQLDALVFTGGVGENAALIRQKIIQPMQHLGFAIDYEKNLATGFDCRDIATNTMPILVIRGDEEALIAQKVANQLTGETSS